MAEKQLIVVVEGTMAMGPDWLTILSDYVEKFIRSLLGNELSGQKPTVEMSLVTFYTHGSYSGCLVRRSGWTRDIELFLKWLSAIPLESGGFGDAAIAEGLSEALMMFSTIQNGSQNQQNVDFQKHCILFAASNPHPLPTPVYRPQMQNLEQSENSHAQTESHLYDAEAVAKSFAQCFVSLSVICPKQLPKLKAIYNAGKRNPQAADSPIVNVKNPHFLVLISEDFIEAWATLSHPGSTTLPLNPKALVEFVTGPCTAWKFVAARKKPNKKSLTGFPAQSRCPLHNSTDPTPNFTPSATTNLVGNSYLGMSQPMSNLKGGVSIGQSVPGMSQNLSGPQMVQNGIEMNPNMMIGPGSAGSSSGTGSMIPTPGISQQAHFGIQLLGANSSSVSNPLSQQMSSALQCAQSKDVKVWEGSLAFCALNQEHSMFITRLEGYRSASASETLAANWPPTLQIVRLISQDRIKNKPYAKLADFLVFQAMDQDELLWQMQEMKLFAVIKLPSQTLLLSVSDKDCQLNGMLLPWDMVMLRPGQQLMPPQLTTTAASASTNAATAAATTATAATSAITAPTTATTAPATTATTTRA